MKSGGFLRGVPCIGPYPVFNRKFNDGMILINSKSDKSRRCNSRQKNIITNIGDRCVKKRSIRSDYRYIFCGRLSSNVERKINDNALTALALLIAESDPKDKEVMIKIIKNLISE